jgi:ElaB/YqjD/DUF883 family membrane-anchored ribosome-binding protein
MVSNGNRISEHLPTEKSAGSAIPSLPDLSKASEQVFKAAQTFVAERPIACLAGAFATGMVIAWFIKRSR